MNILFIRVTNRVSGAERYNYYLGEGLKEYTKVSPIFLTNCNEFLDGLKARNLNAHFLPINIPEIGTKKDIFAFVPRIPRFLLTYFQSIHRLNKSSKIDVVCLESMTEKIFLTPFLRLLGYKVIWIEHGPLFRTKRTRIIKWKYRFISMFANKIIAVSDDTRNDLIAGGVFQDKVVTIYIGVDTEYFRKIDNRVAVRVPHGSNVIGFVGTLNEEKGIRNFLDLAKKIIKQDTHAFFVIAGDGPLMQHVEQLTGPMRDKFLLTGFVEDVRPYVQRMDVVIFPTMHHEGISLAILEALACGTIVFARDIGGNRELIVNGKTGYLYTHDDPSPEEILRSIKNREQRSKIEYNAIAHVHKFFNQKKQALTFQDFFRTLV